MLAPARSLPGGIDAVRWFFAKFGSLQFDPIAVAGRSHNLVLHARVADYDPAWCDTLYERREIFEAVNKGLSFVATSEYPWFRAPWSPSTPRVLDENPQVAEHVLERIRAQGPLSSLDFERRRGAQTDWFGAPTNVVRAVLEAYRPGYSDSHVRGRPLLRPAGGSSPRRLSGTTSHSRNSSGTSCTRAIARTACLARAPAVAATSSAASAQRSPPPTGRVIPVERRCGSS
jgi:hypothetical protein